jgi:hypothetical protein
MKAFAHWKNITLSTGRLLNPSVSSDHLRGESPCQIGPGHGPIQFIVDIPDETMRDEVVAKWVLECGFRVNDETDGMGFEEEWPQNVRTDFDRGYGDRWSWPCLK